MDFTPPSRFTQEVKVIMDYLVPDYLNRIPGEKLSEFLSVCIQAHNLHWQMAAIERAKEEQEGARKEIVDGKSSLLNFKRSQGTDPDRFLPSDDLPF